MKVRLFAKSGLVVVTVMLGLFLGGLGAAQSKSSGQLVATSAKANQLPPMYQRWLDEDVVYIISPEEKAAFLKLSTENERDKFVQQFWLRRDPTPDTEENEYKEEHYRRLAFANQRFAESSPGWQSDRGRTYIVYGPPDEITRKSVKSADGTELPAFLWHYESFATYQGKVVFSEGKRDRSVEGPPADLLFVDSCNCGAYKLQKSGNQ